MKMQKNRNILLLLPLLVLGFAFKAATQESEPRQMILDLRYYMPADKIPYLKISAKEKVDRKFNPLKDITASVYMGEESENGLLGKIKTDSKGESKVYIPASFKSNWDSSGGQFTFIAVSDANKDFESTTSEIGITRARLEMDTISDEESKNINVKISEFKNGEWVPVPEADLRIVIKRLLGNLPVGEEEVYTSDEDGMVSAIFIRDSLPGDNKGLLTLIARTEDNEMYGNIFEEITVPWGIAVHMDTTFFNHRTLWSTRDRTPIWLLFMAYIIIAGVWGTLIYLFIQLFKTRKLGKTAS